MKHLCFSNECPSESEAVQILPLQRSLDHRIAQHTEVMKILREGIRDVVDIFHAAIDQVHEDQRKAIEERKAYGCVLAPVRRLPTEILFEIFQLFVGQGYAVFNVRRGPWVLGKVCKRWRTIVLASPELWASLRLDTFGPSRILKQAKSIIRTVLALSQPSPLRIATIASLLPDVFTYQSIIWWEISYTRYLQRVEELEIHVIFVASSPFPHVNPGHLPNLKKLHLTIPRGQPDDTVYAWPVFQELPQLSRLVISGLDSEDTGWDGLTRGLPYAQLVELSFLRAQDLADVIVLLLTCTKLEVLDVLCERDNTLTPAQPILLPRLRRLNTDISLIRHISVPRLSDLELSGIGSQADYDLILKALFERSNRCQYLRKFRITSDRTILGLNAVLRTMPGLVEFSAQAISFQTIFMDTFLGLLAIPTFLVSLSKITLNISDLEPTKALNHNLTNVLTTRFRTGALRSFVLMAPYTNADIDTEDLTRLQKLRGDGLHLSLSYGKLGTLAMYERVYL